ncbi:uncharacterized protein LOC117791047 [Drosophila innubila]|uniref:uncharacterized protein LOC117791047 n=1 Tax=Drosophila innubila TaxID=198719 RepID=UPI00148C22BA|nr:uncharacterized protein LOC117791047 [Drosophila innubila]
MILRIVNAAPANRFETSAELDENSNFPETSNANISKDEKEFSDDLQVAENRQQHVKSIQMFDKPFHRGNSLDIKTKKNTAKISNSKNMNVKFPVPKAASIDPQPRRKPGNVELTISIPRFNTDIMGNWVYNPWGATFGDLFRDTRFNFGGHYTIPRMYVDSMPWTNYYPNKEKLSTVCVGKTSPYNEPPVMNWITPHMYSKIRNIKFMKDLRRSLYDEGHPDECHTSKYVTFLGYINCAILRNQRMEYLIPYYPRHQNIPANYE